MDRVLNASPAMENYGARLRDTRPFRNAARHCPCNKRFVGTIEINADR